MAASPMPQRATVKLGFLVGLTSLLLWALEQHLVGLNGPAYWRWPWREAAIGAQAMWLLTALPLFFAAQAIHARWPNRTGLAIGLLMFTVLVLELVVIAMPQQPPNLANLGAFIRDPGITSYFTDAVAHRDTPRLLADYPHHMRGFHLHSVNKPPGPIFFYLALLHGLEDPWTTSVIAGCLIALLATLAIPVTYGLLCAWLRDRRAAFHGASYLSLCPALVGFVPEFDQAYPLLSTALLGAALLARQRPQLGGVVLGLCVAFMSFVSYSLFVLGFSVLAILAWDPGTGRLAELRRLLRIGGIATLSFVSVQFLLWSLFEYDAWATFRRALEMQSVLAARWGRPWPTTILFDLTDFALGSAWLSFLLVAWELARRRTTADPISMGSAVMPTRIAVAQLLLVAATGLLRTETARVWIFMLPLLMIPVGQQLSRFGPWQRSLVHLCQWLLMTAVLRHMVFIQ